MSNAIAAPSTDELNAKAADALAASKSLVVDSPEMFEVAAEHLKAIKALYKIIEDTRLSMTRPLDESKRKIMDLFKPMLDALEKGESELKRKNLDFQQEQARIAREAAERADRERREIEEANRREAERLAAEAAAAAEAGDDAKAEELALESIAVESAPVMVETPVVEVTKVAGVSTRDNWIAEVTDIGALIEAAAAQPHLRALLTVDTKALSQMAKAYKGAANIPGVRVFNQPVMSVRR